MTFARRMDGDSDSTPLKTATVPFYNNNKATLIVHPHLEAFCTGRVLLPGVEIFLELFCNRPEFFLFGTNSSGVGVKCQVTLSQGDLKVTLHLCGLSLNPSIYNALQAKRKVKEQWSEARSVRFCLMDGPPSSQKITCLWAGCWTG